MVSVLERHSNTPTAIVSEEWVQRSTGEPVCSCGCVGNNIAITVSYGDNGLVTHR